MENEILFTGEFSMRKSLTLFVAAIAAFVSYGIFYAIRGIEDVWLRNLAYLGLSLSVWGIAKNLFKGFMTGAKIPFVITTESIKYGSQEIPWENVGKIYSHSGINIKGKREHLLCYESKKGILVSRNKFDMDKRFSTDEFQDLCDKITQKVLPRHPHITVKKP